MASDAIEIHGGNGYIETWPVARILRDAQINTLWEGPGQHPLPRRPPRHRARERRRAVPRAPARGAVDNAGEAMPAARIVPRPDREDLAAAIEAWKQLDGETPRRASSRSRSSWPRRSPPRILCERAEWELREFGDDRKCVVAIAVHRALPGRARPAARDRRTVEPGDRALRRPRRRRADRRPAALSLWRRRRSPPARSPRG